MNSRKALSWLSMPGIKAVLFNWDRQTNDALREAIKALKKQVAISYKVVHLKDRTFRNADGEVIQVYGYMCPSCNQELGDSDWDGKPDKDWTDYCPRCGQKIDWIHDVEYPDIEPAEPTRTVVGAIYGSRVSN